MIYYFVLNAVFLTIMSVAGSTDCNTKLVPNNSCSEPEFLHETPWISRQAFSIVNPSDFQTDFKSSIGHVIREKKQSVQNDSNSFSSVCKNDKKGRKKRKKNPKLDLGLPKAFPKDALLENALCEWKVVENVDMNRQPRSIMENKCKCRYTKKLKRNYLCESVQMYVRVLRRASCKDGVYSYKLVWEPYSIACTAVKLPSPNRLQTRKRPFSDS